MLGIAPLWVFQHMTSPSPQTLSKIKSKSLGSRLLGAGLSLIISVSHNLWFHSCHARPRMLLYRRLSTWLELCKQAQDKRPHRGALRLCKATECRMQGGLHADHFLRGLAFVVIYLASMCGQRYWRDPSLLTVLTVA